MTSLNTTTTTATTATTENVGPSARTIDALTLKAWEERHDDLMIVDVRSGAEFDSLHIKGSYHVPLAMLGEHAEEFAEKMGTRVVLVCQSGNRAEQARKHLGLRRPGRRECPFRRCPRLCDGRRGRCRGRGPWALERQVRMAAGSLVLAGVLGSRFFSPKLGLLAGGIGAGLAFSAATNSCAMGQVLSRMPWNRSVKEPTAHQALRSLDAKA